MTVAQYFERGFGFAAAVTATANGRVNMLGEHTDYNDGFVLPTAITLQTEVAIGPSHDGDFHFISQNLSIEDSRIDYSTDQPPTHGYGAYVYGCIEVLRRAGTRVEPCCIAIESTVPIGSGLSSSAALEVAVLRGLRLLQGAAFDDVQVAQMAQKAEIEYAKVNCGIMDQMASSLGQPGQLLFLDTRSLETRLLPFPEGTEIAVFDSGVPRTLADSGYNERRRECEAAAARLGVASLRDVAEIGSVERLPHPLRERARHVVSENRRVQLAASGVVAARFGELMNDSHRSLRDDFAVSVPALDVLVQCVLQQSGALGCKLTGAGFGGACVALLEAGTGERIKAAAMEAYARAGFRGRVLL